MKQAVVLEPACSLLRAATAVGMAIGPQPPPQAPATMGKNCKPSAPQLASAFWCEHFLTSYSATACWPLAAVWARDPSRMPEVTARSKAAGPSSPQLPIHSSAGRVPGPARPPSSGAPPSSGQGGRRPVFRRRCGTNLPAIGQRPASAGCGGALCGRHHAGKPWHGRRSCPPLRRT